MMIDSNGMARFLLIIVLALFVFMAGTQAISFGASPGVLTFENMLKDGYAEHYVVVSSNSPTPLEVEGELIGNYSDWLSFEPADLRFSVSQNRPFRVKVIVRPPGDVQTDQYQSYVRFITQPLGNPQETIGSALRASIIIRLNFGITGEEIERCIVGGIGIPVSEEGYPLLFNARISNQGNVRLRPDITIDVWDLFQENLVKSFDFRGDEILPTVTQTFSHEIVSDLEPGQYWGFIKVVPCGYSTLLTFDVAEEGGVVDKGVLESVTSVTWAHVNQTLPVTAIFKNLGARFVSARFKGTISLGGSIVELLETDELRVEPGESVELETFFVPRKPGSYEIAGKVLYNQKLTFEKGTIVNVNPAPKVISVTFFNLLPLMIYILIFIIIIFLIFKIRRERNKHRRV